MTYDADAIVIGAGHNGLVCAGYLAKQGLDVLVLERSHRIGGACITEELLPGYHFSTFAYNANGPGPKICRDLEIPADAFEIVDTEPRLLSPFPDGERIVWWGDPERSAADLARFGPREVDGFWKYHQFMQLGKEVTQDLFLRAPISPQQLYEQYRGRPHQEVVEAMLLRSHWDVLCDFFQSDKIRCALARADDCGYPTAVGSLLAELMEAANDGAGVAGRSGIVRGGMGRITSALADAAGRFGARIETESAVEEILVEHGAARGVRLQGGTALRAPLIVSNADPKRTFLKLVSERHLPATFRDRIAQLKTRAGYMKYHAALSAVPRFCCAGDLPAFASVRIAPSLAYYEQAWLDAQSGIPARQPILSLQFPTLFVPEMAPHGKHILGIWVRYAPRHPRNGGWDHWRSAVAESIVATIEQYAPGFHNLIEWQRLYTTADIEQETGITDASIRHVDMTLDQMLTRRPLPEWSPYRTPIPGLWLCGSGTHPCGSVTGAPGHNAAAAILASEIYHRASAPLGHWRPNW